MNLEANAVVLGGSATFVVFNLQVIASILRYKGSTSEREDVLNVKTLSCKYNTLF